MKEIIKKHRFLWSQKFFLVDIGVGILLLAAGLIATYFANSYTVSRASNSVTDILLDNLPVVNVDFIYSTGAAIFIAFITAVGLYEPRSIPFALKSSALFFLVRAIFMMLTHIAPPLQASYVDTTDFLHKLSSGDDLFFSAHTGFPFLFTLIFWDQKYLKYIFLLGSIVGGGAVILGHLHYSIDVFSAFFITFGIYHIAKTIFAQDYQRLLQKPED